MTAPRRDNLLSAPAFPWSGRDERGTSARADRPFEGVESGLGRPDLKVDRDWKGQALQPEIGLERTELETTGIAARDRSTSFRKERPARQSHAGCWFVARRELEHSAARSGEPPSPGIAWRSESLRYKRLRVGTSPAHREIAGVAMPVLFASGSTRRYLRPEPGTGNDGQCSPRSVPHCPHGTTGETAACRSRFVARCELEHSAAH